MDLQAKVIPLLPPNTNPLALGALGPHKAIWHWVLLSQFPGCTAPSYHSSRISFPGCWRRLSKGGMPQHGRETCTEELLLDWLNLPSFPKAYRSMIHLQLGVSLGVLCLLLVPSSSTQEVLGDGLRELQTTCMPWQIPSPKPCLGTLESLLKSSPNHLKQRKDSRHFHL